MRPLMATLDANPGFTTVYVTSINGFVANCEETQPGWDVV
jgi:hypothetical protein